MDQSARMDLAHIAASTESQDAKQAETQKQKQQAYIDSVSSAQLVKMGESACCRTSRLG